MDTINYNFTITRADKLDKNVRSEMSEIFADGFSQWLSYFSKDKNKIAKAFAHMFVLDQFYVAIYENKVVGMAACTDCKTLSVILNKSELKKHLGFYKGTIAGIVLKKEFACYYDNLPLASGSIEFVGTASQFRGKGVASQLINYIINNTPYHEYLIDEVADTNIPAINLYKKLGFIEYKRISIPQKKADKIGINNLLSLKYKKT